MLDAIIKRWDTINELSFCYVKWSMECKCKFLIYGDKNKEEEIQKILEEIYGNLIFMDENKEERTENAKEKDTKESDIKKESDFIVDTEEEARQIFSEVLLDLYYFQNLHINIPLSFESEKRSKEKKREVHAKLGTDYRTFYKECAYQILLDYYQGQEMDDETSDQLSAKISEEYIRLVYTE